MSVPMGKKIPLSSLLAEKSKDKMSGNSAGEKKDVFAMNARKWNHA